jgi:hypothetical protein
MTAFARAFARASAGIDWSRPCLIWLCDYVEDVTGFDPASRWRHYDWNERRARRAMASAGRFHPGDTPVERALCEAARTGGWVEASVPYGATVGVFNGLDGVGLPAIFDGRDGWLLATAKGAVVTRAAPSKMWRLPVADLGPGAADARHDDGAGSR